MNKKLNAIVGMAALVIIAIPIAIALHGFAVMTLWNWFIVSIFGVSPLSFGSAVGLALIVAYMTARDSSSEDDFAGATAKLFARPLLALAIGWCYVSLFTIP